MDIPIYDLNYLILDKWVHEIIKKDDLTKKQYYNMSIILRQTLEYALELGIIEQNPFVRVKVDGKMFRHIQKPESNSQVFTAEDEKISVSLLWNITNLIQNQLLHWQFY